MDSTLFTFCPPAPPLRAVAISISAGFISISHSSASGNTTTVAADVLKVGVVNAGTIDIGTPAAYETKGVELMATIENIEINPDQKARVVINEKTGTIVIGEKVRISKIGISHGNINLKIVADTKIMIGENVLAIVEGKSKKDEFIVVSSHYDHLGIRDSLIYFGADDNASGTSAVLEMARIFQKAKNEGMGSERSILFMNVSGEEKGLLGSSFYVKHPIIPLKNTIANLNIDMIGRTDEKHDSLKVIDYIYLIGGNRLSNELADINKKANTDFTKLELDSTFDNDNDPNRYYQRSDHYNFAKNNIPVIFYFNGAHADYHKPTDTMEKINFSLLKKRAQLVFLTAWELVNRSERIKLNKQ